MGSLDRIRIQLGPCIRIQNPGPNSESGFKKAKMAPKKVDRYGICIMCATKEASHGARNPSRWSRKNVLHRLRFELF
jgi:hypothetical protein